MLDANKSRVFDGVIGAPTQVPCGTGCHWTEAAMIDVLMTVTIVRSVGPQTASIPSRCKSTGDTAHRCTSERVYLAVVYGAKPDDWDMLGATVLRIDGRDMTDRYTLGD